MKQIFTLLLIPIFSVALFAQKKTSHIVYNSKGKKTTYKKMVKTLAKNDFVFLGELHNNPISHWLQYEITADLHKSRKLILGAEMLEADNQKQVNDYLNGTIDQKQLDTLARLWPNYKTDYAPLVDFAKENEIAFIASNIPRRFANQVYRRGFETLDSLSSEEKSWIAPLPIKFDSELTSYKNILNMMGGHGSQALVRAQAVKDATMAHFILTNYKKKRLFIHYNGAYHSDLHEGIVWYLKQANPSYKIATVTTVSQDDVYQISQENQAKADFIICVDSDMTTTY